MTVKELRDALSFYDDNKIVLLNTNINVDDGYYYSVMVNHFSQKGDIAIITTKNSRKVSFNLIEDGWRPTK